MAKSGKQSAEQNYLSPQGGIQSSGQTTKARLANVENITQAVLWVGIITVVAIVTTCCALVLDQMHFNNQTYRDQNQINELRYKELSEKIRLLEETKN